MSAEILHFPQGFLWGTASPPLQLAEESVPLKSPGTNAHGVSIEWSRLEPEEGAWATDVVEHYARVMGSLTDNGIVPFVTLHHSPVPEWLVKSGGWESQRAAEAFEQHARRAVRSFGKSVRHWLTADAPPSSACHMNVGSAPTPGMRSLKRDLRVYRNTIWAHARAYHAIHDETEKLGMTAHVGLVRNLRIFDPLRKGSILDAFAAGLRDTFLNWHMLNSLRAGVMVYPFGFNKYVPEMENCFDFVVVNYRSRQSVRFALGRPLNFFGERTGDAESVGSGFDREIDPDGLYEILASVSRFGKPVYITENGGAKDSCHERCRLMVLHMKQVYDAIRLGGDVQGYFLFLSRNDADSERKLYRRICAENGLPADLVRRYCPDAVW